MGGANDLRVSSNGGPVLADTSCTAPSGTITNFRLGADSGDGNRSDVICKFVGIIDRVFNDAELQAASVFPYAQLFEPRRRIPVALSVGGFKPAWACNSNVLIQ